MPREHQQTKPFNNFLQVYRITPNANTPAELPPAQIMFARKLRSVFEKRSRNQTASKCYVPGEKNIFKFIKKIKRSGN